MLESQQSAVIGVSRWKYIPVSVSDLFSFFSYVDSIYMYHLNYSSDIDTWLE